APRARKQRSRVVARSGLPEADLAAGGYRQDASPARGSFARREEQFRAEPLRLLRNLGDTPHLDVRQPKRPLGFVLDDSTLEPIAECERQVVPGFRVDFFDLPAEEPREERARAREVGGAELQVYDRVRRAWRHALASLDRMRLANSSVGPR